MNQKGRSWWIWVLLIIFLLIMKSAIHHSVYNDITGEVIREDYYENELQRQQGEDYYQQSMEEELQRQSEQEQYENQLKEQQRKVYKEGLRRQQEQQSQKSPTCSSGWKCKDSNTKAYQHSDCFWSNLNGCEYGCTVGECNPAPCSASYLNEKNVLVIGCNKNISTKIVRPIGLT